MIFIVYFGLFSARMTRVGTLDRVNIEVLPAAEPLQGAPHPHHLIPVELIDAVSGTVEACLEAPEHLVLEKIKAIFLVFEAIIQATPSLAKALRPLGFVLMILVLNGCMSMRQPDHAADVEASSYQLSSREMTDRERQFSELLEDPTGSSKTPALQSGINDCQRERMLERSEYLFQRADGNAFSDLMSMYREARNTLGIMNYDRYSRQMVEIALENYNNPELRRDRDVVMVVMSRKDHEQTIFDIQALNVESGRVEELTKAYKVILVETSQMSEILHHMRTLEERGILRPGNLRGILFGTHADAEELEAGVDRDNAHQLARFNRFLMGPAHSSIILAACLTHEGGHAAHNIANVLQLILYRALLAGNPRRVVGIDFEQDARGYFLRDTLELHSIPTWLTLGLIDETTWVRREDAMNFYVDRLWTQLNFQVPKEYLRQCVAVGILGYETIRNLHGCRHGSGPGGRTSPETFRLIMECFSETSDRWAFIRSGMPLADAQGYRRLGYHLLAEMSILHEKSVSPADVRRFFTEAERRGVPAESVNIYTVLLLTINDVPLIDAIPFFLAGIQDPHRIRTCLAHNISPVEELLRAHGVHQSASVLRLPGDGASDSSTTAPDEILPPASPSSIASGQHE